jgi:hypothetical protein
MIDDNVTQEEKQDLGEVLEAIAQDLTQLRRKVAFALRCDELDVNLDVRWGVVGVNSCARDGYPTYCGTTLTHGMVALHDHEFDMDSWKLRPL